MFVSICECAVCVPEQVEVGEEHYELSKIDSDVAVEMMKGRIIW